MWNTEGYWMKLSCGLKSMQFKNGRNVAEEL